VEKKKGKKENKERRRVRRRKGNQLRNSINVQKAGLGSHSQKGRKLRWGKASSSRGGAKMEPRNTWIVKSNQGEPLSKGRSDG